MWVGVGRELGEAESGQRLWGSQSKESVAVANIMAAPL